MNKKPAFQKWLRANGACQPGMRQVEICSQPVWEAIRHLPPSWLYWLIDNLDPPESIQRAAKISWAEQRRIIDWLWTQSDAGALPWLDGMDGRIVPTRKRLATQRRRD